MNRSVIVGLHVGANDVSAVACVAPPEGDRPDGEMPAEVIATAREDGDVEGGVVARVLAAIAAELDEACDVRGVAVCSDHLAAVLRSGEGLVRAGCVRLAPNIESPLPPLATWPAALRDRVAGPTAVCRGGHSFDGAEIVPLDEDALRRAAREMSEAGVGSVAVTSVFSPVAADAEIAAAAVLRDEVPQMMVVVSHEVGAIGVIERENATVLNAALLPAAEALGSRLRNEITAVFANATAFFARDDATIAEMVIAQRLPIMTLSSPMSCALVGASRSSGAEECVAIDVAASSTTVGLLRDGLPRLVRRGQSIENVPIQLRQPDVLRVPLGSSATDTEGFVAAVEQAVVAIDPSGALPVVLVGADTSPLDGALDAQVAPWAEFASAVGAATTFVAGDVERVVGGSGEAFERGVADARRVATEQAILAGAAASSVQIAEVAETPWGYLPGDVRQLRVRALGRPRLG